MVIGTLISTARICMGFVAGRNSLYAFCIKACRAPEGVGQKETASIQCGYRNIAAAFCIAGVLGLAGCSGGHLLNSFDDGIPAELRPQWNEKLLAFIEGEYDHETVAYLEMRADFLFEHEQWSRAFQEYEALARASDKFSQYRLAGMYEKGLGTEQDLKMAYVWAVIAAESGDQSIDDYLIDLTERVNQNDSINLARLERHVKEMYDSYSTMAVARRARDELRDEIVRSCTGSRLAVACFGNVAVLEIDVGRDMAAFEALGRGNLNSIGRLRGQDGSQFFDSARLRYRALNTVLEQYRVPAGRVEYGPLIISDEPPPEDEAATPD